MIQKMWNPNYKVWNSIQKEKNPIQILWENPFKRGNFNSKSAKFISIHAKS